MLVDVALPTGGSLSVYAGEERPGAIDWSKRIQHLETFDSTLVTVEGVHVGSLVSDVEKVYGKVTSIDLSEIESRQYVSFERQPAGIQFRIDYTGEFPEGERRTTRYRSGARIYSISVSR
ncbi:MAG TPA: hypothetical protein VGD77_15025 [Gemmatimonadaceae bacterium]